MNADELNDLISKIRASCSPTISSGEGEILTLYNHMLSREDELADVDVLLASSIAKVTADIETRFDKNAKRRLKTYKKKLEEWQQRLSELRAVAVLSTAGNDSSKSAATGEKKVGGAKVHNEEVMDCQCCFESFSKTKERVSYCNITQAPSCGGHNSFCRDCMKEYLQTEIGKGYVGRCPQIYCPEVKHEMPNNGTRAIMSYNKWSKIVSSAMLTSYKSFAEGYLLFLCGSCHNSRSQLIPFDEAGFEHKYKSKVHPYLVDKYSSANGGHEMISANFVCPRCTMRGPSSQSGDQKCRFCNICTICCGKELSCSSAPPTPKEGIKNENPTPIANLSAFVQILASYELGRVSAAEFYDKLYNTYAPKLKSMDYRNAWTLISRILSTICDPERRSAFQIYYWNRHPKFDSLCCSRSHCFRCKTKDFHDGKSCEANMSKMDSSVLPCPSCFVYLAKGDGCDSVTCVCGHRFTWTQELKKFKDCSSFEAAFPVDTSKFCAEILCGVKHLAINSNLESDWSATQAMASTWRQYNRTLVDKAIFAAWRQRFPLNADLMIAKIMLKPSLLGVLNVQSCVRDAWYAVNRCNVDNAKKKIELCNASIISSLYPSTLDKLNATRFFASIPSTNLSVEEATLLELLEEYKAANEDLFSSLFKELLCKSALHFLRFFGNESVSTLYIFPVPTDINNIGGIPFNRSLNFNTLRCPNCENIGTLQPQEDSMLCRECHEISEEDDVLSFSYSRRARGKRAKRLKPKLQRNSKAGEEEILSFYTSSRIIDATWGCEACTFVNKNSANKCEMCATSKTNKNVSTSAGSGGGGGAFVQAFDRAAKLGSGGGSSSSSSSGGGGGADGKTSKIDSDSWYCETCSLTGAAASFDLPPGCAARRSVSHQTGRFICETCSGNFNTCFGSYGMRDNNGHGTWLSGSSSNLDNMPESPNKKWCCAACEKIGKGRKKGHCQACGASFALTFGNDAARTTKLNTFQTSIYAAFRIALKEIRKSGLHKNANLHDMVKSWSQNNPRTNSVLTRESDGVFVDSATKIRLDSASSSSASDSMAFIRKATWSDYFSDVVKHAELSHQNATSLFDDYDDSDSNDDSNDDSDSNSSSDSNSVPRAPRTPRSARAFRFSSGSDSSDSA